MKKHSHSPQSAFTLLEMLLVIAIIAILASIVIIAINPGRQLAQARNAQRTSDLKSINNAVNQYYIDYKRWPDSASTTLDSTLKEICDDSNLPSGCVDLDDLVPTYLSAIPSDPQATEGTDYRIALNSSNKLQLTAESSTEYSLDAVTIATTSDALGYLATYTITFDANGGTGSMTAQDITETASANLTSNSFTRTSYSFAGWSTTSGGSVAYADGASYTMGTADLTLYAQWTANPTYTVTYDGNTSDSGSVPTDASAYENGETVTVLGNTGNLAKAGYTFNDWNTAANGSGTARAAAADFTMGSANVVLYAQWTAAVVDYTCGDPALAECWSAEAASAAWGPFPSTTNVSTDITLLNGKANTATLYALDTNLYPAAKYCYELTEDSVPEGTWYLPSYAELESAYFDEGSTAAALFTGFNFWSSTENSENPGYNAWILFTIYGSMYGGNKFFASSVRCLR